MSGEHGDGGTGPSVDPPADEQGHHDDCAEGACPVGTAIAEPPRTDTEKCPPHPGVSRAVWRVTGLD